MSTKNLHRFKMAMYALVLVLAELIQTSVFGTLHLGFVPCAMPVAVACISMYEGGERGGIFGLAGGCLWAWSTQLSYYGVWCILFLTAMGVFAGLVTERFLLPGLQTALAVTAGGLLMTEGLYTLIIIFSGQVPPSSFFTAFLPGVAVSLVLCLLFHPIAASISRIGGSHG